MRPLPPIPLLQDPEPLPLRARPEPYADDVRAAVDTAFAENEGLRDAMRPQSSFLDLDELWEALWRWFIGLIQDIDGLRFSSPGLYWLLVTVLVLLLIGLLVHIAWTFRRAWTRQAEYRAQQQDRETIERIRRHADWIAEARRLADGHSYREAVHALVVSLLALLDERNVLHVARSWTLREITARVALRGGAGLDAAESAQLREFGRLAERATYAAREPDHADWQRLEASTLELAEFLKRMPAESAAVRTAQPAGASA